MSTILKSLHGQLFGLGKNNNLIIQNPTNGNKRVIANGKGVVSVTDATVTLDPEVHGAGITSLNRAAGIAVTLPAATGSGQKFTVFVGTAVSSNSITIKAASASDSFVGSARGVDDDVEGATGFQWNAETNDDTVTMNGTATGGKAGDYFNLIDAGSGIWLVEGSITQSGGSEATPFSATVS